MADRVKPKVKLLFPCDDAVLDLASNKWVLTNPWAVIMLPTDATFPLDHEKLWLYAQLTGGIGDFDLVAELRLVLDDNNRRVIKNWRRVGTVVFSGAQRFQVIDIAFPLTVVPFDQPGVYEFRLLANYALLRGTTTKFRVLDGRNQL